MGLPTLKEFLKSRQWRNSYVTEPGFTSLYVRFSTRFIDGVRYDDVLDLASVNVGKKGKGTFTRLVIRLLDEGYILYVESVLTPRFAEGLIRMGFSASAHDCFFKMPKEKK